MKDEKKSNISVTRSSDGNYIGCWLAETEGERSMILLTKDLLIAEAIL